MLAARFTPVELLGSVVTEPSGSEMVISDCSTTTVSPPLFRFANASFAPHFVDLSLVERQFSLKV
jgi:hypothetical protein